jgi:hypothetical protein
MTSSWVPLGIQVEPPCKQQMDIHFIRKDQGLTEFDLLADKPDPAQARDAVGIIIFGYQLRPLPHPAHLVEPAAHRLGGDRDSARGPTSGPVWHNSHVCGTSHRSAGPL